MAVITILYGNYYPLHGEFKLICIGKFARRTWVNFTQQYEKNRQRCQNWYTRKKLIHCMAVFTILYGNYYPLYGEFELKCIGKFARRTLVNFTQEYGKNRQRCQQNKFTMLYCNYCYIYIENFPQKFSPCSKGKTRSRELSKMH